MSTDYVSKIAMLLPTGVYSSASVIATLITPTSVCAEWMRILFAIVICGLMGVLCGISAVWQHLKTSQDTAPRWEITALRAIGSMAAYEALVILTQPGNVCLFPNTTGGQTSTRIPAGLINWLLPGIAYVAGILPLLFPAIVTDPIPTGINSTEPNSVSAIVAFASSFLPIGTYTFFSVLAGQVVADSPTCSHLQRALLWISVCLVAFICFISALFKEQTPKFSDGVGVYLAWFKPLLDGQAKLSSKDWIRAVLATTVFLVVAIFTPPGTTCMLQGAPGWVFKSFGRIIMAGVIAFVVFVTLFRKQLDWLYPPCKVPSLPTSVEEAPHPPSVPADEPAKEGAPEV